MLDMGKGEFVVQLGNEWDGLLEKEFEKPYYQRLRKILIEEYRKYHIYPNMHDIFNACKYTSYRDVKVVILGQDPYHGKGQAHGLSFSVQKGTKIPPSLQNIFKEIEIDVGKPVASAHGDLTAWAKQGILLLNTVLTVREKQPNSHRGIGWELLTDHIIGLLNDRKQPIVFVLWGNHAKTKQQLITNSWHLILQSAHPSPFSADKGFFGCRHFSRVNEFLQSNGQAPIDWLLTDESAET